MSDAPLPASAQLFDGKTAIGLAGSVSIYGADLRFLAADGGHCRAWPLATLRRTDLDAPGHAATFRSGGSPERLTIRDPAVLLQLDKGGVAGARWTALGWSGLFAATIAGLGLAALAVAELPSLMLPLVPHGVERAWSDTTQAALTLGGRQCDSPDGTAQLTTLMARLSKAAGVQPAPSFSVTDNLLVNAFTLPDGRIVILRGLLDRAEDGDELAGVLAHELGHVRARDPTREMLRGFTLNMLARSLGWGGNVAGQMTALSFGRRAEQRADASALRTLRAAGLHADGLSRFFLLLQGSRKDDGLPAFLSDHPTTSSRAETLRVARAGEPALTAAGWDAVKGVCSPRQK